VQTVVILPMATWIDLLISFSPWILLLGEVYLGKRVYDATRRRSLLHQRLAQLRLLTSSHRPSPQRTHASNSASQGASHAPPENLALLLMFREQLPAMPSVTWDRLATVIVVASVFVLAYLGMSVLLRPFANRALLGVLPLCLPLAAIPLPYLFSMKPRATLLLLTTALGLSFLTLVLMGV
jgi:hypothetical protein